MPQDQPKQKSRRWPLVGLAAAVLGLAGVGLNQAGVFPFQRSYSALARISMVHDKIDAIVAAAVKKGDFETKVELVLDEYAAKGNPPKAMGAHSHMKVGGEGKWPKIVLTFAAKPGKGKALKEKLDEIFEAVLKMAPKREVKEIKESVTISADGDVATFKVVAPKGHEQEEENADMKAAFKQHKPEFHGDIRIGRTFKEMMGREGTGNFFLVAPRGIQVSLDAVFANTIFDAIAEMKGLGEQVGTMLKVLRMAKARDELYYSSDKEVTAVAPPHQTLKDFVHMACSSVPGPISSALEGLGDVLEGVQKAVLEGLPYDWEVVTDFENVDPSPFLERCVIKS